MFSSIGSAPFQAFASRHINHGDGKDRNRPGDAKKIPHEVFPFRARGPLPLASGAASEGASGESASARKGATTRTAAASLRPASIE